MTRYLLDTGPLAALLLGRPPAVALTRPWIIDHAAVTSVLVYGEVVEYLVGRPDSFALRRALHDLLADIPSLLPTFPIMDRYAHLRRQMRPPRGPGLIGDIDTLIAATALHHDLTVVTTDGDFTRVPDLSVIHLTRRTFVPIPSPGP